MNENNTYLMPEFPFAKHSGSLQLGGTPVDCYVLDDERRVISMRATVKAIASDDNGDLCQ